MSGERVWIPCFHYHDYHAFLTQRPQNNDSINHWQVTENVFSMKGFHFSDGNNNDSIILHSQAVCNRFQNFASVLMYLDIYNLQSRLISHCCLEMPGVALHTASPQGQRTFPGLWTLNTNTKYCTFHKYDSPSPSTDSVVTIVRSAMACNSYQKFNGHKYLFKAIQVQRNRKGTNNSIVGP